MSRSNRFPKRAMRLAAAALAVLFAALVSFGCIPENVKTQFEDVTHEVGERFDSICFDVDVSKIEIKLDEGGACRAECHETEKLRHTVEVKDGVLKIESHNTGKWYERFFNTGFIGDSPKVTLYLNEAEFVSLEVWSDTGSVIVPDGLTFHTFSIKCDTGSVDIGAVKTHDAKIELDTGGASLNGVETKTLSVKADTGYIGLNSIKAETVSAETDTGRIKAEDVECDLFDAESDTGAISLINVTVSGKMTVKEDTGAIKFENCEAGEIEASAQTGSITGTLRSEMVFDAKSDLGKVEVPSSTTGGRCWLRTDTGRIKIEYANGH